MIKINYQSKRNPLPRNVSEFTCWSNFSEGKANYPQQLIRPNVIDLSTKRRWTEEKNTMSPKRTTLPFSVSFIVIVEKMFLLSCEKLWAIRAASLEQPFSNPFCAFFLCWKNGYSHNQASFTTPSPSPRTANRIIHVYFQANEHVFYLSPGCGC